MRKALSLVAAMALFMLPTAVLADSISPGSFSASIAVGGTATVNKTVTVSEGGPTTALVDVFFLADTTGSMGGSIGAVKTGASSIMTSVAGLGNAAFAVGEYKDNGDDFVFRQNQNITTSTSDTQTGINAWYASGGGDYYEAELYALKQMADTTSWRAGSTRIAVWFGDAPGHDPSGPTGVTLAQATAALVAQGIKVEAIDVGALDGLGQASSIAAATGGAYFSGISTSTIVSTITSAIATSFETYNNVTLDLTEVPAGLSALIDPSSYVPLDGSYDRTIDRTFGFDLSFTGVTPGTYDFNVYALVDGGRIATEAEHIVVGDGTSKVPEPGTLFLLGSGLVGLVGYRRRARMM